MRLTRSEGYTALPLRFYTILSRLPIRKQTEVSANQVGLCSLASRRQCKFYTVHASSKLIVHQ